MQRRQDVPIALTTLARLQADVVTREQARATGLSDDVLQRLLRDRWRRLTRGVYLTAGDTPTWSSLAWAGVLAAGDGARLGPQASGWLHGIVSEAPAVVDVLVPRSAHPQSAGPWSFHRERPGVRLSRTVGSPPRLAVEDTVLDLATGSEGEVIALLTTAVQRRLTTPTRLRDRLGGRARHPRRRLLTVVLGDVDVGAQSVLEVRYLRDVERAHGLPDGRRQHSVRRQRQVTDVDYEPFATLVELDGALFHDGVAAFRDLDRDNVHALLGRLTMRYGWFDVVERPCRVAAQVAAAIGVRGWPGPTTRCPRCRNLPDEDWVGLSGIVA